MTSTGTAAAAARDLPPLVPGSFLLGSAVELRRDMLTTTSARSSGTATWSGSAPARRERGWSCTCCSIRMPRTVDRVQVTVFPVITGKTGTDPIFGGAADFDLELLENRTLDGHIQGLIYRPTVQ